MASEQSEGSMAFQVLQEHGDRYRVRRDRDGAEFDVPKKGLSKSLQSKIQQFARGGMAGYADGGEAESSGSAPVVVNVNQAPTESPGQAAQRRIDEAMAANPTGAGPITGQPTQLFRGDPNAKPGMFGGAFAPAPGAIDAGTGLPVGPEGYAPGAAIGPSGGNFVSPAQNPQAPALGPSIATAPSAPPAAAGPTPVPTTIPPGAPGSPAPRKPPAPQEPGQVDQLDKAYEGVKTALRAKADVEAERADEQSRLLKVEADRQAKAQAETQRIWQDRQAASDKMFRDYQAAEVDPNRLWASRSTGAKIGSVFAIMLGGIGMGIAGQPGKNPAMDYLNAAIERDVKAQELNISKKGNALRFYADQTKDLMAARQLALADAKDLAALQLRVAASKYDKPEIKAQADVLASQLNVAATKDRQEASAREVDIAYKRQEMAQKGELFPLQKEAAQLELGKKRDEAAAVAEAAKGNVTPEVINRLPKETRERVVLTPAGYRVATTPQDATEAKKKLDAIANLNGILDRMAKFRKDHPGGTALSGRVSGATAEAQSLYSDYTIAYKEAAKLGALTGPDMGIVERSIPSPDTFFISDKAFQSRLDSVRGTLNTQLGSVYRLHFRQNVGAPPEGRQAGQ